MNLERVAALLASGLKPSHVATIVGCTPARITQLSKESTEFQDLLLLKTSEMEKKDVEEVALSSKYHAAEHMLIDQMLNLAPISEMRDVTAALRVIAERQERAKTRTNPIISSQPVLQQLIQISIPSHALPEISLTSDREVISINNTTLAPLGSKGVTDLFANMNKEKHDEPRRIPVETEGSFTEVISAQAKGFLDSLHPAPFAESF